MIYPTLLLCRFASLREKQIYRLGVWTFFITAHYSLPSLITDHPSLLTPHTLYLTPFSSTSPPLLFPFFYTALLPDTACLSTHCHS
jgi:hypothetical protein